MRAEGLPEICAKVLHTQGLVGSHLHQLHPKVHTVYEKVLGVAALVLIVALLIRHYRQATAAFRESPRKESGRVPVGALGR